MRTGFGVALVVVLAVGTGGSADEKDTPVDAKKLVGRWVPQDGKKDTSVVIEFTAGGKLVITTTADSKTEKYEGTYKVAANKLVIAMKVRDAEVRHEVTVLKLTDAELLTEDEKGKKETFARAAAKK